MICKMCQETYLTDRYSLRQLSKLDILDQVSVNCLNLVLQVLYLHTSTLQKAYQTLSEILTFQISQKMSLPG